MLLHLLQRLIPIPVNIFNVESAFYTFYKMLISKPVKTFGVEVLFTFYCDAPMVTNVGFCRMRFYNTKYYILCTLLNKTLNIVYHPEYRTKFWHEK